MHPAVTRIAASFVLLAGSAAAHALPNYGAPAPIERPGFVSLQPFDISDGGLIVGHSEGIGFVYAAGVFTSVVVPGASSTNVTGIAGEGELLVGTYWQDDGLGGSVQHGFLVENGVQQPFDLAGATSTSIRHVSDNGRYLSGTWADAQSNAHGFAFDRQTQQRVDFLASGGGFYIMQGANDQGLISGNYVRFGPGGAQQRASIVYDFATGTTADYPSIGGVANVRLRDVGNAGLYTGFAGNSAIVTDLVSVQVVAPGDASRSSFGYGINDLGVIVGFYQEVGTGVITGWVATPVPEPAAGALWALGLAGLAAVRRRGRARA